MYMKSVLFACHYIWSQRNIFAAKNMACSIICLLKSYFVKFYTFFLYKRNIFGIKCVSRYFIAFMVNLKVDDSHYTFTFHFLLYKGTQ